MEPAGVTDPPTGLLPHGRPLRAARSRAVVPRPGPAELCSRRRGGRRRGVRLFGGRPSHRALTRRPRDDGGRVRPSPRRHCGRARTATCRHGSPRRPVPGGTRHGPLRRGPPERVPGRPAVAQAPADSRTRVRGSRGARPASDAGVGVRPAVHRSVLARGPRNSRPATAGPCDGAVRRGSGTGDRRASARGRGRISPFAGATPGRHREPADVPRPHRLPVRERPEPDGTALVRWSARGPGARAVLPHGGGGSGTASDPTHTPELLDR